jgi:hypothetical protein
MKEFFNLEFVDSHKMYLIVFVAAYTFVRLLTFTV